MPSILRLVSEITTKGRIFPKNANAVPHILQDKHAWEKVVTIKQPIKAHGNIEENFKSIITLLEKESIMSESYFIMIDTSMSSLQRYQKMRWMEKILKSL